MSIDGLPELPPEGSPPDLEDHFEALEPNEQRMLVSLYNGPTPRDLELLRRDDRLWTAMARIDVYPWLVSWFTPIGDWVVDRLRSGPIEGTQTIGVAWSYSGIHDKVGTFNGLPATGRRVLVRGFTIMGMGDEEYTYRFLFSRYIDWVKLYTQLGLAINWRVPVPPGPEDVITRVMDPAPDEPDEPERIVTT